MLQAPLWINPGYFSHDELQWAAHAEGAGLERMPWVSWTDVETFQYRPLTFNAWLLLSRFLFDSPRAFHLSFVALGCVNALALFALLRRMLDRRAAALGTGIFILSPYAAYVHGWVATLADLIWVGALLACIHAVRLAERYAARPVWWAIPAVAALTFLALLAKESALSIPGLIALCWWLSGRRPVWLAATAAAAAPAVVYLAIRGSVILFAPRAGSYAWALDAVPLRLVEYFLYPFWPGTFEVGTILARPALSGSMVLAGLAFASIASSFALANRRILAAWLSGSAIALGPVLVLTASANQYGYAFAAVFGACVAFAWRFGSALSRSLLVLPLLIVVVHACQVQSKTLEVGRIQQRFYGDLEDLLRPSDAEPIRIVAERDAWIYRRITHDIPSYRGVPIGNRVTLVEDRAIATHRVLSDGRIER